MIVRFREPIKIRILIFREYKLTLKIFIFIFLFLLLFIGFFNLSSSSNSKPSIGAMKVHPIPKKRNNITVTITRNPNSRETTHHSKKLRRLPHVFSRVLELPFRSDADVSVEESTDFFRFVAEADTAEFRAHTVEIHPGVTKIVVRETLPGDADADADGGGVVGLRLDELDLDMWRFRLPETTRPELASAVFVNGELIVTVPKGARGSDDGGGGEMYGNAGFGGLGGRLVLVQ